MKRASPRYPRKRFNREPIVTKTPIIQSVEKPDEHGVLFKGEFSQKCAVGDVVLDIGNMNAPTAIIRIMLVGDGFKQDSEFVVESGRNVIEGHYLVKPNTRYFVTIEGEVEGEEEFSISDIVLHYLVVA